MDIRVRLSSVLFLLLLASTRMATSADEGMWTFDNPPLKQLKDRYGFTPAQQWLDHVRLSSVRFNDGGSGSFVSPNGLAITNHHVAFGQLQKLSNAQKDYVRDGFYARTQAEELKCTDLELDVLMSMHRAKASPADALIARYLETRDIVSALGGQTRSEARSEARSEEGCVAS